jgi:DNA-directed RNA polymerase specialized sigma24 family protein
MSQRLPDAPAVDYYHFAFDEWTPGRVKFCLMNWPVLEEAVRNGVECADWPPSLGGEATALAYPKNMSILTTAADMHIAIRKLPPKQAVAVTLYYKHGWTFRDVGDYMECSHVWARQHVLRGQARLECFLCSS